MEHRGPLGEEATDTGGLFPSDAAWTRTRVLDAQAVETSEFHLDDFARYRRIRILTYSSSVQMLHTVLDRFPESHVECVLGYSRVVNDMAAIVALQTAVMEDVRGALGGLSDSRQDEVLERVRDGRLHVRVVQGHVSHAKIFLLSEAPDGGRCVLTGSANFSTSALLGDQHEVLIRFRDDRAWEHFEGQYLEVRDHASAEVRSRSSPRINWMRPRAYRRTPHRCLLRGVARRQSSWLILLRRETPRSADAGWRSSTM